MSGTVAVDAALAALGDELAEDDGEQLGLFGEAQTAGGRELQAQRRGPGRPLGARNRRTERTVAFLLSRHRDPRQVLLEIAEANVDDLVALLGCTRFEALQEKRLAAIGVLPYVAQRQPLSVDVTDRKVVYLTISDGQVAADDAGIGFAARVVESVEYQEVSGQQDPATDSSATDSSR